MGQRRKHVTQAAVSQDILPPAGNQQIVRALGARGGNLVEVECADGSSTLCMMPAKFNRKLWVRRGGFLIIEHSEEAAADAGSRVTGTIVAVLYDAAVKQLKKMPGVWPPEFMAASGAAAAAAASEPDLPQSGSDNDGDGSGGADAQQADGGSSGAAAAAAADAAGAGPSSSRAAAAVDAGGGSRGAAGGDESSSDDDGLPPLQQISNRRVVHYEVSDSDDSEDEEDEG